MSASSSMRNADKPITAQQILFATEVANGAKLIDAYAAAGYSSKGNYATRAKEAHRIRRLPKVDAFIRSIVDGAKFEAVMCMRERRSILASMARTTPLDLLDDDGKLRTRAELGPKAHAIRRLRVRRDLDGDTVTEVETVDRIAAIREDAVLAGERNADAQVTLNQTITLAQIIATLPPSTGLPRYDLEHANGYQGSHPIEIEPPGPVRAPPVRLAAGETNGNGNGNGHHRSSPAP